MLLNGEKNPTYKFLQDTELISTPRKTGKNQPVKKALRKKIFFSKFLLLVFSPSSSYFVFKTDYKRMLIRRIKTTVTY